MEKLTKFANGLDVGKRKRKNWKNRCAFNKISKSHIIWKRENQ